MSVKSKGITNSKGITKSKGRRQSFCAVLFFVRFCVVGAGRLTVDFQVLGGAIDFVERNTAVDSERDGRGGGAARYAWRGREFVSGVCAGGVVCAARDRWGVGIGGVVFGIRYARGAYAGSMVGWVSVAAGDGMRVAGCRGMSADIFVLFGGGGA